MTSVWMTANAQKNTHTHTQTKQALFGWNSPPCPLWICVHAASNVYCIPIKCDKHNAFKLSSSPHFFNQLQTWTFLFSVSTRYNYMSFIEAPNELAWRIGHVHRPKRLGWSIVVGLYIYICIYIWCSGLLWICKWKDTSFHQLSSYVMINQPICFL